MNSTTVSTTNVPDIWKAMYASIMARQNHPTGTRRRLREIRENREDAERYLRAVMNIRNQRMAEAIPNAARGMRLFSVSLVSASEAMGHIQLGTRA